MAPHKTQLRQTGGLPCGDAAPSSAGAAATSQRPLSLLDLGDGPLERILALLPQEDKLLTVPVVCKRLHQILSSRSPVVWECLDVELKRKRRGRGKALLEWSRQRTDVLRSLRLSIEVGGCGRMQTGER